MAFFEHVKEKNVLNMLFGEGEADRMIREAGSKMYGPYFMSILERFLSKKIPRYLAHYTSVENLKNILTSRELWLSSPLLMNDKHELMHIVDQGVRNIMDSKEFETLINDATLHRNILAELAEKHKSYEDEIATNTFILSFSATHEGDVDGKLSMWRGYGAEGDGVAIVFDTEKMPTKSLSPLGFGEVGYQTQEQITLEIADIISSTGNVFKNWIHNDNSIKMLAFFFLTQLTVYSIFTKDNGFDEEAEVRLAYNPSQKTLDQISGFRTYSIGPDGISPRLRFSFEETPPINDEPPIPMHEAVHRIIIGPGMNHPAKKAGMKEMLRSIEPELVSKMTASSIPYRRNR